MWVEVCRIFHRNLLSPSSEYLNKLCMKKLGRWGSYSPRREDVTRKAKHMNLKRAISGRMKAGILMKNIKMQNFKELKIKV